MGITKCQLRIGDALSGAGVEDIYASRVLTGISVNVTGLPNNPAPLYARVYDEIRSAWNDIAYTAQRVKGRRCRASIIPV